MKEYSYYAIWNGKDTVTPVDSIDSPKFSEMWENKKARIVAQTWLPGMVLVSTVFLGINHNWIGTKPLWFETMIFGGQQDEYCERYSTAAEARAGHLLAVERVRAQG